MIFKSNKNMIKNNSLNNIFIPKITLLKRNNTKKKYYHPYKQKIKLLILKLSKFLLKLLIGKLCSLF